MVEKIRSLCKQKNTSISKVEKELGFGNGTISKWSKFKPTYERLKMVAEYFNVSIDFLAEGAQCSGRPSDENEVHNEKDIKSLLSQMTNEELWELISEAQKYLREKS